MQNTYVRLGSGLTFQHFPQQSDGAAGIKVVDSYKPDVGMLDLTPWRSQLFWLASFAEPARPYRGHPCPETCESEAPAYPQTVPWLQKSS